jgi:DNA-binding CsgD family transcriptional regulator
MLPSTLSFAPAPSAAFHARAGHAALPPDAAPALPPGAELAIRLLRSLDHVGRGMLLVGAAGRVLHANRLANQALADGHPLQIAQGRLGARNPDDAQRLSAALQAAMQRDMRQMLHLGPGANRVTVAVLPIDGEGGGAALVSLEQPRRKQDLAVQCYARQHGLTGAETAVLEALLDGLSPSAVARAKYVAVSTVRTQISQLRLKTGARSIRQLLDRVAGLPPMMGVVQ